MRQVGIGLIVLIMLALFAVAQFEPKDTQQTLPEVPSFSLQDVTGFSIEIRGQPKFETKKKLDKWLLVGSDKPKYLNGLAVEQLLHDLQTMQVKRVVVRKTELFQRFAADENLITLKDKNNQVLLAVFIGKPATDLRSTYIRFKDDFRVLTVDKVLTWQIKRTVKGWLEKEKPNKDERPESFK